MANDNLTDQLLADNDRLRAELRRVDAVLEAIAAALTVVRTTDTPTR